MSQLVKKIRTSAGDCQIDYNALANLPDLNSMFSNPNILINGDFQVWQRGDYFSNITNAYSADRWLIRNATTPTNIVQKSTVVPDEQPMTQSMRIYETTALNTDLRYMFEHKLRGTFTLSFWYKTTAAFNTHIMDNGAAKQLGSSNVLNTWTKAIFTFEATDLEFINIITAAPIGDYYITGVKLEYGAVYTPFVPRTFCEEHTLCRRFYNVIGGIRVLGVERSTQTNTISFSIPRSSTMRAIPTVDAVGIVGSTGGICVRNLEYGILDGFSFTYEVSNWEILVVAHSATPLDRQCYEAQLFISNDFQIRLDAEVY